MPSWSSQCGSSFPKELGLHDWLWLVEKALNDMREASKAFQTQVHRMFAEDGWVMVKTVYHVRRDTLCGFHGDDFYTEGEPSALDEVDQTIVECFKAKIMPRVGPCDAGEGTVLRRVLVWNETCFSLQPDPKHFQNNHFEGCAAHVERCAGTTRQSGSDLVQEVRWDLHQEGDVCQKFHTTCN